MSQEQRQQAAREEKLVPTADRVKISATNMRIEPSVPQKEETFQVILDIIKSSPCFKAFTIIADVPKIYMQQFWFTVKKLKKTPFYEFDLDDKKFQVDVEVFREILGICLKVPSEYFVTPPSEKDLLAFLIEFGYKGPLDHLARMFVDHMHQPWRTLAIMINKRLYGKTSSNDRLRQLKVAILWSMFYRKNVDNHELIWEDLAYQVDYRQAKLRRRKIIPYPRCTKIIINRFLLLNPSIPKGPSSGMHIIKDDGVISILKFVIIGKYFQEYGCAIPKTMLTKGIKQTESYQTFTKYFIGLIPPKKSRGKGSQGKNRRKSKKKVSIYADDNIIPELDVTLELGKSMSLTEAAEEEAARQVHATLKRLVMESDPEPAIRSTRRRPSGIAFRDTSSLSKKNSPDQKKSSRSQPHTGGSSEGTGVSLGVLDESTIILTTSSEGIGTKPRVPDEVKGASKAKVDSTIDWGSEEDSEYLEEETINKEVECLYSDEEEEKKDDDEDDKSIDIENTDDDEETNEEFVHGDEYVHADVDKEMKDAKVAETGKDDEEITIAKKIEVTKGDLEQAGKLPLTSSILSVSSSFGSQFLNLSFDTSLIVLSLIPEIPLVTPATTPPPPPSVSTITPVLEQTTTPIPTPPITTVAPPATTVPYPLPTIAQRVSVLEKDVQEIKQVDHSAEILPSIRS
ncbi:hypothetical protein Tco_0679351 [Tanacetum coccineum]|uniref:Uncharacterized protein n=1 Tax=Tanacetum coccineum TaxID=301880 RepID=A0ABQ4XHQ6_9ASTR